MSFIEILSFLLIFDKLIGFLVVLIVIRNSKSLNKDILWIVLILLFPFIGSFLYLLFGSNIIKSNLLKRISKTMEDSKKYFIQDNKVIKEVLKKDNPVMLYLFRYCNFPITKKNQVNYYQTGELFFDKVKDELKGAKKFIFIEFFSIASGKLWSEILDILKEKVQEGIEIRIIYDNSITFNKVPYKYYNKLKELGIQCEPYYKKYPLWGIIKNHHEHRKCIIIDGKIAFTGGVNIEDKYVNLEEVYGYWKDMGISVSGESVWNFTVMFLSMWNGICKSDEDYFKYQGILLDKISNSVYVIPFGDTPLDRENISKNVYIQMIYQAKKSIVISMPYLILDIDIYSALANVSKRGVDVKIIIPGIPDKKIVYQVTLLNARKLMNDNVHVYTYTPGFLHGKVILVDDKMAVVGTMNMDYRSFYSDFEYGIFIENVDVIQDVKKDLDETLNKSVMLKQKKSTFFQILWEGFLCLFTSLM